jgi:2-polyprenyl-3-methyl-5-hydroxy-6-metoxy-1,4-benzoquinol methylase
VQEWIPALDGVEEKLRRGARVADVGAGLGVATILLAQAYPESTFVGFDSHLESIEAARANAAEAGVADRVRFELATATGFSGQGYDLIACFDALHDMGDPAAAAAHIRSALAPDGTLMVVEPQAGDAVADNLHPLGRVRYGFSTLVCTPGSLSQDGRAALGTLAGEAKLSAAIRAGGFSQVRRATETELNLVLEARP